MSPSECYAPFMEVMMSKIHLSKLVIELLRENSEATYEDLLNHLQTAPPLNGQIGSFTEDTLIRHSQFVVDQVRWFNRFGWLRAVFTNEVLNYDQTELGAHWATSCQCHALP